MTVPPTGDRRKRDRRTRRRRPGDTTWFGGLGPDASERRDEDDRREAALAPAAEAAAGVHPPTAFDRIFRVFLGARAALGASILVALAVAGAFGNWPSPAVVIISLGYAALAFGLWQLPRFRSPARPQQLERLASPRWVATIGADIVCFTCLHLLSGSSSFNYAALLVMPVLMAAVLTPRRQALGTAAAATLALLGAAWLATLTGTDIATPMTQAGLAGSGLFLITILAGEVAGRLAREELSARGSLELARQQAQLNRLVIEEMQDGVLVVDRRGRVRTANPAARQLLAEIGLGPAAPFQLRGVEAWEALVRTVERAFADGVWPESGRDVMLEFDNGELRTLRVRIRFTLPAVAEAVEAAEAPQAVEEFCVLLLEDVRNMQARTRQEKLAAMGRVSAGIAHEIRNPLAAIAQANALMSEDATTASQRQLTRMVADNVDRLKRIVDDVMEVAPGQPQAAAVLDIAAEVAGACGDWAQAAGVTLGSGSALRVDLPAELVGGLFDSDHLRRVLVNLLDNGHRHSSQGPGAVHVRLYAFDDAQLHISVMSDGPPITPEVERYLFEPFFSTRSRGTGLGLYICRELCERYGASIDFRLRAPTETHRNDFFVAIRRAPLTSPETPLI